MKNYKGLEIKNIIKSILVIFLLSSVSNAEYCNSNFDCDISKNDKVGELLDFTCMVKNIPIIAEDVFDKNGSLKTYFGTGETVCDVLGWINKAADNLDNVDGLATGYKKIINKYALLGN